ncbi:MAG: membrane dipeptidase [Oscillospiraceae bacterium]|nr:membrane dipeptidase [Oscillospiraceae bacterium]
MNLFDLHCDSISRCLDAGKSLLQNDFHLDIERGLSYENWVQTFAIFIHDDYEGHTAYERFLSQYNFFLSQMQKSQGKLVMFGDKVKKGVCNAVLSVENGSMLENDIDRVKKLSQMGARFLTLCWNGENQICGGADTDKGLTDFGAQVVKECEESQIVVDVSHLNEKSFFGVCKIAQKPIVATHSNAKSVHNHRRNLTDAQIEQIADMKGLIGINLYPLFLNGKFDASVDDILRHIDHLLNKAGEKTLAIGTDFDGADMPTQINNIERLEILYKSVVKSYDENLAHQIFCNNALDFIQRLKLN